MYKARLLPAAKQDIRDASHWYNEQVLGLGKKMRDNVRSKVATICLNPEAYAIRYDNIRTTVLDVFPFMIHFYVDEQRKIVVISAVLHTGRKPDSWKR